MISGGPAGWSTRDLHGSFLGFYRFKNPPDAVILGLGAILEIAIFHYRPLTVTQKTSMLLVVVLSRDPGKPVPCPRTPDKSLDTSPCATRQVSLDAKSVTSAIEACAVRQMRMACCFAAPCPGGTVPASVAPSRNSMDATASLQALSRSERIVLSQLASGARVGEIAARLSRSPKTVSTQKASIMRKLRVATDFDLHGLISRWRLDEATQNQSARACRPCCRSDDSQGG